MTARGRTSRPVWALALFAGALAAACAGPVQWQKPGASQGQWETDRATCRSRARREAERDFRAQSSRVGSPVYDEARTLAADLARHDAKRHERALFERCLESRGYGKSAPAEAPAPDSKRKE